MLPSNVDDKHEGNAFGEEDLLETRIGSDCAGRLEKLSVIRTLGNVKRRGADDDSSSVKSLNVLPGWGANIFPFTLLVRYHSILHIRGRERLCDYVEKLEDTNGMFS